MELSTFVVEMSGTDLAPYIFLYVGPDVFLPLMSALAAILGALLVFWQRSVAMVMAAWRFVFRRGQPVEQAQPSIGEGDGRP